MQTGVRAGTGGALDEVGQVLPVHPAGNEVTGSGVRIPLRQPAQEVIGVVRKGTHATGGHVEEMAWIGCAVGHPRPGPPARIDEPHPDRPPEPVGLPHQLHRRQRPGGPGTDDRDLVHTHSSHRTEVSSTG
ncbi:hypothetical protein GCM10020256_01240 [Streptomyces thermocoprophilus]